ncbi:MAG: T9SS type A sorting domain-containing protein [Bacteroidaceae bacterium]|nr:T9SS type A sorting domain-containing protein [Bacteroidaceae bacterium]
MKKIAFIALALVTTSFLSAQESTKNLVSNGDFENTDYTLFSYDNGSVTNCPNVVSGWDLNEASKTELVTGDFNNVGLYMYTVRAEIQKENLATDGGNQCLRIQRYEWYSQTDAPDGGIQQTINVLPSAKYDFSFMYRLSSNSVNGTIVPAWYSVTEIAADGTEKQLKKKKLYNELNEAWYTNNYSFTASATAKQVRLNLGVTAGTIYSWGGSLNLWADFDNVTLVQEEGTSIEQLASDETQFSVSSQGANVTLSNLDVSQDVVVYDVAGNQILSKHPSSESENIFLYNKGVYVIRNGSLQKSVKVVIQ